MLVLRSLFSSVSGPTLYFHASFPESLLPRQYPFMYSSTHSSHANDSLQMVVQDCMWRNRKEDIVASHVINVRMSVYF